MVTSILILIIAFLIYKCYQKYIKLSYYHDKQNHIVFPINQAVYSLLQTPSNSPNSSTPTKPHRLSQTFSANQLQQHIRKRLFVDKNVQTDEPSHHGDSS